MSALSLELMWKLFLKTSLSSGAINFFLRYLRDARLRSGISEIESNWSRNKEIIYISVTALR